MISASPVISDSRNGGATHHPEPDAGGAAVDIGRQVGAVGRAREECSFPPRAATQHPPNVASPPNPPNRSAKPPPLKRFEVFASVVEAIGIRSVGAAGPFRYVARHINQAFRGVAPGEHPRWGGAQHVYLEGIAARRVEGTRPCVRALLGSPQEFEAPRRRRGPATRGGLPLCLGRQAVELAALGGEPDAVGARLVPANTDHGLGWMIKARIIPAIGSGLPPGR